MAGFPFDTIAFDLDGTLADTGPDLAATLNHVRAILGREPVPVDSVPDSITDADTAKAAGIPFIAVSFGYSDRPASELGADAVIDDYGDLVGALAGI